MKQSEIDKIMTAIREQKIDEAARMISNNPEAIQTFERFIQDFPSPNSIYEQVLNNAREHNSKSQSAANPSSPNSLDTVVCFDFDETLVNGHFHNALSQSGVYPGQGAKHVPELINAYGIKNREKLLQTFQTLISEGHNIAITSYTLYPEIVKPTLKAIGLRDDQIEKIHVEGFLPKNQLQGKGEHMKKAMKHFGVTNKAHALLVDDSENNIKKAKDEGYQSVNVPKTPNPNPEYLNTTLSLASQMKGQYIAQQKSATPQYVPAPHNPQHQQREEFDRNANYRRGGPQPEKFRQPPSQPIGPQKPPQNSTEQTKKQMIGPQRPLDIEIESKPNEKYPQGKDKIMFDVSKIRAELSQHIDGGTRQSNKQREGVQDAINANPSPQRSKTNNSTSQPSSSSNAQQDLLPEEAKHKKGTSFLRKLLATRNKNKGQNTGKGY